MPSPGQWGEQRLRKVQTLVGERLRTCQHKPQRLASCSSSYFTLDLQLFRPQTAMLKFRPLEVRGLEGAAGETPPPEPVQAV